MTQEIPSFEHIALTLDESLLFLLLLFFVFLWRYLLQLYLPIAWHIGKVGLSFPTMLVFISYNTSLFLCGLTDV